ncbi:hypothetical protein EYF80_008029 [Liparis tanakae]|uniref:Uncharacterized protein n=1 Tax=Liparis tanakae TaxID=230148 RepID=A0A4Z2IWF4_9TELE|nr:hypothetical protein EYF80_008029 [Liparis tanakae]
MSRSPNMSELSVKLVNSSQAGGKNAESESVRAALRCLPSHAHTEWAGGGHLALQAAWFSDHCGDLSESGKEERKVCPTNYLSQEK